MNTQSNIIIGMSGGVDSSVTALLLQQQGHTISGITYTLFPRDNTEIQGDPNVRDAKAVADKLGIAHQSADISDLFHSHVIAPFIQSYEQGETPNPCYHCNPNIKFSPALMDELGATSFATGHYAKTGYDSGSGRYLLKKGAHSNKDQSYFLANLSQAQLEKALFPLGDMTKDEIRAIAKEYALPTATRSDSQDICFIPDGDYISFLRNKTGKTYPKGNFITPEGEVLGQHQGIISYTVGQRRGLDISSSGRLYVKEIRPCDNTVVLAPNQSLFSDQLQANRLNFIATQDLQSPTKCTAKIRSRHAGAFATAQQIAPDTLQVTFDTPQRAITAGQAVVLYDGDTVIASGTITPPQL